MSPVRKRCSDSVTLADRTECAERHQIPGMDSGRSRSHISICLLGACAKRMQRGTIMSDATYDAIIVGARCAGSPTAMLLARKGHRVLVVDKSSSPSDIMSTNSIQKPAVN